MLWEFQPIKLDETIPEIDFDWIYLITEWISIGKEDGIKKDGDLYITVSNLLDQNKNRLMLSSDWTKEKIDNIKEFVRKIKDCMESILEPILILSQDIS